ncbi:YceI family protein [soil metagenome]
MSTYIIDTAHSSVRFWVRHLMISKVHGDFGGLTGSVEGSATDPENAKLHVEIDVATVNTGNEGRDGHLKGADFFDVEKFPTMTYDSSKITKTGDGTYDVEGTLTMHGVSKPVLLKAEVSPEVASPFGGFKVGISATGVVNREEFGMTWNQALETGGIMVDKNIHLQIDVELDRPA